jgi:hypothetical protein
MRRQTTPRRAAAALALGAALGLAACGEKDEPDLSTVPEPTETLTQPTTGTTTPTTPTTPQNQKQP